MTELYEVKPTQQSLAMKLFSQTLMSDLENHLKVIHSQTDEPLKYAEQAIKKLITTLEKLKTTFLKHQFENKLEEIDFFRNIKPLFAAKLIYYNDIYNIEINKPFGGKKVIRKYYYAELIKLENYFAENLEFYRYYRSGNTALDHKYFVRGKHDLKYTLDSFYFQADQRFSTSHDYKVAKILANSAIKVFLEKQVQNLELPPDKAKDSENKNTLTWTASKVALIELIYALHTEGVFSNGNVELKEIVSTIESTFNVNLGQFNRVFLEIRSRKSERTLFLNKIKEKLLTRMEEADNN